MIVSELDGANTEADRESVLARHLSNKDLQQHRRGRRAVFLAPMFTASSPNVKPEEAWYQPDDTLTINLVSGDREGNQAFDDMYYKGSYNGSRSYNGSKSLRQSLTEFFPQSLDYDEITQREICLCIRNPTTGKLFEKISVTTRAELEGGRSAKKD